MNVAGVLQKVQGFFETLNDKKPARSVGQKCGMDRPDQLAIDLDGNILSCQNTTAEKGHKIGHIDDYENVRLDTSFHWSQRRECNNCPVLHLCHGSCMLLKEHVWEASCDQFFNWNLTILAVALYFLTDRTLVAIEGNPLRREEAPRRMIVIDL
jgi:uncharacterized protein